MLRHTSKLTDTLAWVRHSGTHIEQTAHGRTGERRIENGATWIGRQRERELIHRDGPPVSDPIWRFRQLGAWPLAGRKFEVSQWSPSGPAYSW
jgi:hypothetical protein